MTSKRASTIFRVKGSLFLMTVAIACGWRAEAQSVARDASEPLSLKQMWPNLRRPVEVLGGRLNERGKERLTLSGSIVRSKAPTVQNAVTVTWEFPGKIRVDETSGGSAKTVILDGQKRGVDLPTLTDDDSTVIETLLEDSAESFLVGHSKGYATELLGYRFRIEPKGNEKLSMVDAYSLAVPSTTRKGSEVRTKLYLIDSDTHLLRLVRYDSGTRAVPNPVEVEYKWSTVGGYHVPSKIVRSENGKAVFTVQIVNAQVVAKANDGLLGN